MSTFANNVDPDEMPQNVINHEMLLVKMEIFTEANTGRVLKYM